LLTCSGNGQIEWIEGCVVFVDSSAIVQQRLPQGHLGFLRCVLRGFACRWIALEDMLY